MNKKKGKYNTSAPVSAGGSVADLTDDVSPKQPDHCVRSVAESAPRLLPEVASV